MKLWTRITLISAAAITIPLFASALASLGHTMELKTQWPHYVAFGVAEVFALSVVFHALSCRLWIKCLAAIPFIGWTLFASVYCVLVVASTTSSATL